jgi:hypothetical protein
VAHTCNPSYSGGRDQEDCGSARYYLEKSLKKKKDWWSGSRCRPGVQAPVQQKTKKKKEKEIYKHSYDISLCLIMYIPTTCQ